MLPGADKHLRPHSPKTMAIFKYSKLYYICITTPYCYSQPLSLPPISHCKLLFYSAPVLSYLAVATATWQNWCNPPPHTDLHLEPSCTGPPCFPCCTGPASIEQILTPQVFSVLTLSPSQAVTAGFAADCITIVGAAKSLVLNDKRFNNTKVWCTFIFIHLQGELK